MTNFHVSMRLADMVQSCWLMAQFRAFEDNVEVSGRAVLAFVAGMASRGKALQILEENDIRDIAPDAWYPQQSWLNAIRKIADEIGPYALYCIGAKIPENAQFPQGIDSLEKALGSIDIAYHMNHRGGEIGDYTFTKAADGTLLFLCHNPYPCEFDRGIIEGIARKFISDRQFVIVRHDDDAPCRDKGSNSCTYRIEIDTR